MNRSFRFRLLLAAILIIALVSAGLVAMELTTRHAESSSQVINLSGRQRMLNTLLESHTSRLVTSTRTDGERQQIRQDIIELIQQIRTVHQALLNGDAEIRVPANNDPQVRSIYFDTPHQLDSAVQSYLDQVRQFVSTSDTQAANGYQALITISTMRNRVVSG